MQNSLCSCVVSEMLHVHIQNGTKASSLISDSRTTFEGSQGTCCDQQC